MTEDTMGEDEYVEITTSYFEPEMTSIKPNDASEGNHDNFNNTPPPGTLMFTKLSHMNGSLE